MANVKNPPYLERLRLRSLKEFPENNGSKGSQRGFAALLPFFGIPKCECEFKFHPSRKYRFDYAWPTPKVAVELEGAIWTRGGHSTPRGILRDIEKYNEALNLGWKVIRIVHANVEHPYTESSLKTMNLVKKLVGGPTTGPTT